MLTTKADGIDITIERYQFAAQSIRDRRALDMGEDDSAWSCSVVLVGMGRRKGEISQHERTSHWYCISLGCSIWQRK